MVRSELRNKFLRSRYSKDRESTKKQRVSCVTLLVQKKKVTLKL